MTSEHNSPPPDQPTARDGLSHQQRRVVELYDTGMTKEQIADELGISHGSVHNHLERALRKRRRQRPR